MSVILWYYQADEVSASRAIVTEISTKGAVATITAKGQVTIPAEIRKALGLKPKDKVAFIFDRGEVKVAPSSSTLRLGLGAVKPRKKPEDFKQLRGKVERWVARKAKEEL